AARGPLRVGQRGERQLVPAAPGRRPGSRTVEPAACGRGPTGAVRLPDAGGGRGTGGGGDGLDEGGPRPDRPVGDAALRVPRYGRVRPVRHPGGPPKVLRDRRPTHRGGGAVVPGR